MKRVSHWCDLDVPRHTGYDHPRSAKWPSHPGNQPAPSQSSWIRARRAPLQVQIIIMRGEQTQQGRCIPQRFLSQNLIKLARMMRASGRLTDCSTMDRVERQPVQERLALRQSSVSPASSPSVYQQFRLFVKITSPGDTMYII